MSRDDHNKGQMDAAQGKGYHPPNGELDMIYAQIAGYGDKPIQENADYKEGYYHALGQKK